MSDPSQSQWEQAKRVLRYPKGTVDSGMMYGGASSSKLVHGQILTTRVILASGALARSMCSCSAVQQVVALEEFSGNK
jgi:hypothetical protein